MSRSLTILVVDDETKLRDVVVMVLSKPGHTVLTADNGYEALRILADRHVDLLVTDVRMPGIDGFELARQAKLMRRWLKVVYLTGYGARPEAANGPTYGTIIEKPFRATELLARIEAEIGAPGPNG